MDIMDEEPDLEVVGTARDGAEAMRKIEQLDPDVVTMDLSMPRLDGLSALRQIMKKYPRPIVVVSAFTREGEEQTQAVLELGVVDYISKSSIHPTAVTEIKHKMVSKIRAAASRAGELRMVRPESAAQEGDWVVTIGASAGGPRALGDLLPRIPAGLPANWTVVQHMPRPFTALLAKRLDAASDVEVVEAHDGSHLRRDRVLVAPAGHDLIFEKGAHGPRRVRVIGTVARRGASPVIDVTMESAARTYGEKCIGVLLSGMGTDGAMGLLAIKEAGGATIAQDESTCTIFGMPKTAVDRELADFVVPLEQIAGVIMGQLEAGT